MSPQFSLLNERKMSEKYVRRKKQNPGITTRRLRHRNINVKRLTEAASCRVTAVS